MRRTIDYQGRFRQECSKLGLGDISAGHRMLSSEVSLSKEDWRSIWFAYLALQHQIRLIVAHREAVGGNASGAGEGG